MMRVIRFYIDCIGLCVDCSSDYLFQEEIPNEWDEMSIEEQEEAARQIFFDNFGWSYSVFQDGKEINDESK